MHDVAGATGRAVETERFVKRTLFAHVVTAGLAIFLSRRRRRKKKERAFSLL